MDPVRQWFAKALDARGIRLSDRMAEQFETYYRLLLEWNEKMNLTGITDREAVYEKHFYDSLTAAEAVPMDGVETLADIGSGAGFPALPLKIVYPHLRVTIVDALAKRIRFLEQVSAALGLDGVTCLHGRAEDIGRRPDCRDWFDAVAARAVARLAALNELCLPFVRPGGQFIAMKGSNVEEELEESRFSARQLQAELSGVIRLELPREGAARHLIVYRKTAPTPKAYPRKAGVPMKSPLLPSAKR